MIDGTNDIKAIFMMQKSLESARQLRSIEARSSVDVPNPLEACDELRFDVATPLNSSLSSREVLKRKKTTGYKKSRRLPSLGNCYYLLRNIRCNNDGNRT